MDDNRVTQAYKRDLVGVETTSLYMRPGKGKTLADMPSDKLMRGMCAKSCRNVDVCTQCGALCTVGRLLLEREGKGEDIKSLRLLTCAKPEKKAVKAPSRDMRHFAQNLTDAFAASGMTQAELSERMGSKQCSVSNWLTGKTMPTLPLLYGLCKVLQVSSDKLLGLEADS